MAHEKGHPIRDRDSTTYVSSFSPIQEFGPMLCQEAICQASANGFLTEHRAKLLDGAKTRHVGGGIAVTDRVALFMCHSGGEDALHLVDAANDERSAFMHG